MRKTPYDVDFFLYFGTNIYLLHNSIKSIEKITNVVILY